MSILNDFQTNHESIRDDLKFVEEIKSEAALKDATIKQKIIVCHNKKEVKREFKVGDLVLKRNQKDIEEGKLPSN
jgi:hypothetical protein